MSSVGCPRLGCEEWGVARIHSQAESDTLADGIQQVSREQLGEAKEASEDIMPRTRQSSHQGSSPHPSHTPRAVLTFDVSLVEDHLRDNSHAPRLSDEAPIFLTAILEFVIRRILELAGNEV